MDNETLAVSIDAPIIASHNIYLSEQENSIRAKTVPWEGYQRAGIITEEELEQIRLFERNNAVTVQETPDRFVVLFLNLLSKLIRLDTVQSILVLLDSAFAQTPKFRQLFLDVASSKRVDPIQPFLSLLKRENEFIQLISGKIAVTLILEAGKPIGSIETAVDWVVSLLQNSNSSILDIGLQFLQSLLSIHEYRLCFYLSPIERRLLDAIQANMTNAQITYQAIYCMWLLTFERTIAQDLQKNHAAISLVVEVAKSAIKEKVVRIVAAFLRCILENAKVVNVVVFLANRVPNMCEVLIARKWSDSEIVEDLEFLKEELGKKMITLSTFDEYSAEVRSGNLEWSPPHNSENFWKSNASKLSDNDCELLRILSRIIATSKEPLNLCVAAYDLGQYAKFGTNGKKNLQELGIKTQIMELMGHPNSDVRYQALIAVQKLMTHSWEA